MPGNEWLSSDLVLPLVRAAGGVVYNSVDHEYQVLLVGKGNPIQWRFPKGMVDGEESPQKTAEREVREESGAIAEIISLIGVGRWTYEYEGTKFRKETTYFLMQYVEGDIANHDREYEHVMWVPLMASIAKLSFDSERSIGREVVRLLAPGASATDERA